MKLTQQFVYEHFELVKSIDGALEQYHYYTNLTEDESIKTDIFIESNNGKIKNNQLETFNRFIETVNWDDLFSLIRETDSFKEISIDLKGKISKTNIYVIFLPYNLSQFDLAVVCSSDYKRFLRRKGVISVRFEFLNDELRSAERKNDTTQPDDL